MIGFLTPELKEQLTDVGIPEEQQNLESLLRLLPIEIGKTKDKFTLEVVPSVTNPETNSWSFYYKNATFSSLKKFQVTGSTLCEAVVNEIIYLVDNGVDLNSTM